MPDHARFRAALHAWAAGDAGAAPVARELAAQLSTVVLVEGVSDQRAVEALAARRGRDLAGEGMCIVPIGGAMSVVRFGRLLEPLDVEVRGLCDEAEERYFRRGLQHFSVCVADLEDELIRAHGVAGVERVLASQKDLAKFRVFQNQPAQRGRPVERQLRRFLGTISGRKARYAAALVTALDPDRVPRPLDRLLT